MSQGVSHFDVGLYDLARAMFRETIELFKCHLLANQIAVQEGVTTARVEPNPTDPMSFCVRGSKEAWRPSSDIVQDIFLSVDVGCSGPGQAVLRS